MTEKEPTGTEFLRNLSKNLPDDDENIDDENITVHAAHTGGLSASLDVSIG